MAVVGVYNAKGGVGKTTLAVDLAWRCAAKGHFKTLLWDLDHQGGSAFLLGVPRREVPRAASIFLRSAQHQALIEPTQYDHLSLLQADNSLRNFSVSLARIGHNWRLKQLTTKMKASYERIILDCPPMINEVSDQILHAVDLLMVPVPPAPLATNAFKMVLNELRRSGLSHVPVLPILSMYNSARQMHREVRLREAAGWPIVPVSSELECVGLNKAPIGEIAPGTRADRALDRLWRGVEAKILQQTGQIPSQDASNPIGVTK